MIRNAYKKKNCDQEKIIREIKVSSLLKTEA
jgi:hypothetical protein